MLSFNRDRLPPGKRADITLSATHPQPQFHLPELAHNLPAGTCQVWRADGYDITLVAG